MGMHVSVCVWTWQASEWERIDGMRTPESYFGTSPDITCTSIDLSQETRLPSTEEVNLRPSIRVSEKSKM